MTAHALLDEARRRGVDLIAEGQHVRVRARRGTLTPELLEAIRRRKPEILVALRAPAADYETLVTSPLVARVQAAWSWLGEHRPEIYQAVQDADDAIPRTASHDPDPGAPGYAGALERFREAMEEASRAYERRPGTQPAVRIYSRTLDAELWVAPDEEAAEQLRREGETLAILVPPEALVLGRMAEADARALFAALAKIQRAIPGSRLRSVERLGADA